MAVPHGVLVVSVFGLLLLLDRAALGMRALVLVVVRVVRMALCLTDLRDLFELALPQPIFLCMRHWRMLAGQLLLRIPVCPLPPCYVSARPS